MKIYRYPAIISVEAGLYSVDFVDFPGTAEKGIEEADLDHRAREILYEAMGEHLETNEVLPVPSTESPRELKEGEEFKVIQLILG